MTRQRRLGRGLEALLGKPEGAESRPGLRIAPDDSSEGEPIGQASHLSSTESTAAAAEGIVQLNIYEIDRNPFQPRRDFDEGEIQQLAESLAEHGMLQPIVVRQVGERHELVSGERRWRAATVAGWETLPARIIKADDRQMAELALVENIQRKDLNPLEKARAFQQYLEKYQCTQDELAGRVNVDRSTIANLIRLLELPAAVQQALLSGAITQGHARAILSLDEHQQIVLAKRIESEGLSVRATEQIVREAAGEPAEDASSETPAQPNKRPRSEHLAALEQELRTGLGTKVDIRDAGRGKGRIIIHFNSHDEFDRLRAHVLGEGPAMRAEAG